jgi:hypothetical protein
MSDGLPRKSTEVVMSYFKVVAPGVGEVPSAQLLRTIELIIQNIKLSRD